LHYPAWLRSPGQTHYAGASFRREARTLQEVVRWRPVGANLATLAFTKPVHRLKPRHKVISAPGFLHSWGFLTNTDNDSRAVDSRNSRRPDSNNRNSAVDSRNRAADSRNSHGDNSRRSQRVRSSSLEVRDFRHHSSSPLPLSRRVSQP